MYNLLEINPNTENQKQYIIHTAPDYTRGHPAEAGELCNGPNPTMELFLPVGDADVLMKS